ncbi:MAG: hypothetical protein IBX56_06980 [Methylomicrobium sp.]|nr:hypothetical protein [Methylomicrobium sp.]
MKVWGVASEDVGSRDRCRQAPMDGFTAFLARHIPYLLFLDGFSIKREYLDGSRRHDRTLLHRADKALYQAKETGHNRFILYEAL